MRLKHRFIWASCYVALALGACDTGTNDDGTDTDSATGGGAGSDGGSDEGPNSGGKTSSGGKSSGGAASGGSASGGTSSGGVGGEELGGFGGLGGESGEDDLDDGEEIGGGEETGSGGAGSGGTGSGGANPGSGGAPPVVPVSASIKASITKQLTPLEMNEPFILEVGTLTYYPVRLENVDIAVPEGWVLSHVASAGSDCPRIQGGTERCLQLWQAHVYPAEGVCQLNKDEFVWTWDAACALGADCSVMPTNLPDPVQFTTKHTSEFFCEQDIGIDPFLPATAIVLPTEGTDPVNIRLVTSSFDPYRFSAADVSVPDGMALVDFEETEIICNDSAFPEGCRQWWDVLVDPGDACSVSGDYTFEFDVDCDGISCDPAVTTYSPNIDFVDRRDLCE